MGTTKITNKELLLKLTKAGIIIYPDENNLFIVEKIPTPEDPTKRKFKKPLEYNLALEKLAKWLEKKEQLKQFSVIMRYNRGLGVEYKNLQNIYAKTYEEAQKIAECNAEIFISTALGMEKAKINQIKIKEV